MHFKLPYPMWGHLQSRMLRSLQNKRLSDMAGFYRNDVVQLQQLREDVMKERQCNANLMEDLEARNSFREDFEL